MVTLLQKCPLNHQRKPVDVAKQVSLGLTVGDVCAQELSFQASLSMYVVWSHTPLDPQTLGLESNYCTVGAVYINLLNNTSCFELYGRFVAIVLMNCRLLRVRRYMCGQWPQGREAENEEHFTDATSLDFLACPTHCLCE